jgi:nucleoside-diphosphate-sugar epimerase
VSEPSASTRQRVFITGALGFIGRALAERYRTLGAEVFGVDMVADADAAVVAGDISAPGPWQLRAAGCDLFIHTAAIVSNAADLDRSWRINVLGTRRALDAAVRGGARRFVHFSTVRAFSDLDFPDGVDERHPVRTDGNPYVDTKIASEQVVLQAHAAGEIPCTVIRPGDVYGPGSRPWTVLPVQLIKSGRFALPAMGRGVLSPVFVENVVDGVLLAAANEAAAGAVLTISDGVGVSCAEFFGHYCRMLGRRGPVLLPTRVAVALARANAKAARLAQRETEVNEISILYLSRTGTYSIARARELLGYEPQVDLDEGMRRTEEWLRREGLL